MKPQRILTAESLEVALRNDESNIYDLADQLETIEAALQNFNCQFPHVTKFLVDSEGQLGNAFKSIHLVRQLIQNERSIIIERYLKSLEQ